MQKEAFFKCLHDPHARPLVMGIVNVTPDSFSDGGKFYSHHDAIRHALSLLDNGADLIDIGGESSRPGAKPVGQEEEEQRILPVIKGILSARPDTLISVDTYRAQVAEKSIDLGAFLINDISAGTFDPAMYGVIAKHDVPYVLMHMQKNPETMQQSPTYTDVVKEVSEFLAARVKDACDAGCSLEKLIIDPGIGFGKTITHNLKLIASIQKLNVLNIPILLGVSRKSLFAQLPSLSKIETDRLAFPENRDTLTAILAALLWEKQKNTTDANIPKVAIYRVHNVNETIQAYSLVDALHENE